MKPRHAVGQLGGVPHLEQSCSLVKLGRGDVGSQQLLKCKGEKTSQKLLHQQATHAFSLIGELALTVC